jgi:hypothetical protein
VVLVGRGKDISSLKGLREISEDVIDVENSLGGIGRASDICGLLSKWIGAIRVREAYKSSDHQESHIFLWAHSPWKQLGGCYSKQQNDRVEPWRCRIVCKLEV